MTALMSEKGNSYINILTFIFITILPIIMFASILGKELVVIIFTFIHTYVDVAHYVHAKLKNKQMTKNIIFLNSSLASNGGLSKCL